MTTRSPAAQGGREWVSAGQPCQYGFSCLNLNPGDGVRVFNLRSAATNIAITVSALVSAGCSSLLYYPSPHEYVDRAKMPIKPEDVYFTSEDGTPLHGWYFRAQGRERPKGAILFFHGNAQNLSTHFFTLYTAPAQGFDYFIFDYRGYGKSQGRPTPEGTVQDGRAALRWLKRRAPADTPVIVFGQSLGGPIALRTALDLKNEIPLRLVVVDSSFSSYRAVGRSTLAKSWVTWLFQPLAWVALSDGTAPERDLAHLAPVPLVVIHGDADKVVDIELGRRLFERARDPKQFWIIPGGGHTDFMWRDNGAWARRFYETLGQHVM